jgi:hypothetical protein
MSDRRLRFGTPLGALAALALAGCSTLPLEAPGGSPPPPPPPPPQATAQGVVIETPFRADDFAWSTRTGNARIVGLTAKGASCAGRAVALTPATPYSRERIQALYGSDAYAVRPVEAVRARVIANDNPGMRAYVRSTRCDANGGFLFDMLPAGPYFIITEVADPQGPMIIMRQVNAVSGRTLEAPLNGPAPPRRPRRKAPATQG